MKKIVFLSYLVASSIIFSTQAAVENVLRSNLIQARSGCLPTDGKISTYEEYRQHLEQAKEWEIYYKAQNLSIPNEYREMIEAYRKKAKLYEQQLKIEDIIDHKHPLSLEMCKNNYEKSLENASWCSNMYKETQSLFHGIEAAEYRATADLYLAEIKWHPQQERREALDKITPTIPEYVKKRILNTMQKKIDQSDLFQRFLPDKLILAVKTYAQKADGFVKKCGHEMLAENAWNLFHQEM